MLPHPRKDPENKLIPIPCNVDEFVYNLQATYGFSDEVALDLAKLISAHDRLTLLEFVSRIDKLLSKLL